MARLKHPVVLTGPAAAAALDLDGFRGQLWKPRFSAPYGSRGGQEILRTRHWVEPSVVAGELVAAIPLVLRHLNAFPEDLKSPSDGISPHDRVELATEHARRLGHIVQVPSCAHGAGDEMLRLVRRLSGMEPPTESFAETRTLQWLRSVGLHPWRQLGISISGKTYRVDFGLSLGVKFRPALLLPQHALIIDLDSQQFHSETFEADNRRRNAFDRAGFHHIALTPREVSNHPERALATIQAAIRRAGGAHPTKVSLTRRL